MAKYNLAEMTRRAKKPKRKAIPIRDIPVPSMFAGDLYRGAYAPVIALWASAIPVIMAEYERTQAAQTQDSPADIQGKIADAERRLSILSITLTPFIERWALRVEQWTRGKWRNAVLSATNVDIGQIIGPLDARQTVESAINYNVALVKDVSAEAQRRMTAIIYDGLRGNKPAREVAKELREAVGLGRARSVRIASDQLSKLTSSLADERRRDAGITAWKWLHSGKLRGRADHIARNGNIYSDDLADVGQTLEGQTVKAPPEDRPGQLPFCGCRSQSVLSF